MMNDLQAAENITADLLDLGVRQGGVMLVHSSLRSLGQVPGGAETVIRGLLGALGGEGTLLMPALGSDGNEGDPPVFDVLNTPTWVGAIAEAFRVRRGTRRSVHPTHSVCGVGRLAKELLAQHEQDNTPCGPHSPFRLLRDYAGQILMLGCGLAPNTSFHAIEELIAPPYLFKEAQTCTLRLADGKVVKKRYRLHGFVGWRQRYDRVMPLLEGKGFVRGKVLKADSHLIDAPAMWAAALSVMRRDPLFFVERISETGH